MACTGSSFPIVQKGTQIGAASPYKEIEQNYTSGQSKAYSTNLRL